MEFIQRRVKASTSRAETKVVAMGCIHHGAAGCDERLADFWYQWILKRPDTYVILGGDLVDSIYEKDGMKKIRHSRVRMFLDREGGKAESFLISLDDMFLFQRGWAFTSVSPGIRKETLTK